MASLLHSGAAAPRLAASSATGSPANSLARTVISPAPRLAVVAAARSGYERRGGGPSSGGWDDEDEDEFGAGRPMQANNSQGGAQQGTYRPRRPYNQNRGDGQYNQNRGDGQYNQNRGDGQYSTNGEGYQNRGDGQQQQQQGGQYRPRKPYTPRGDGQGGEGRPFRGPSGGGRNFDGEQQQRWQGPRQTMTPEQLAMREEVNQAVRTARGWREISTVLSEKAGQLDAENITGLFIKMSREQRPSDPQESAAFDSVLSALLGWSLNLQPTYRPRHTSRTLSALGRMQLYSPEVVQGLVTKASEQLGNFDDQDLCNTVLALGQLGQPPSQEFMTQFFMRTKERFSSLRLLDMSSLLQGLIKLGVHTTATQEWLQGYFTTLQAKCLELPTSQEAHRALRGDSEPQAAGSPDGEAAQQPQQPQRPGRYNNQRRGGRQQERSPLEVNLEEYVELLMAVATLAKDTGYQPSQEAVDALLTRQSWRVLTNNWAALSRILWATTNLAARPGPMWFASVDKALYSRDRSWEDGTLPGLCLYLGRYLQHTASPQLSDKLAAYIDDKKARLGPEGLAPLLFLLGNSGFKPVDRWLDSVLIYLQPNAANCSMASLELLYSALPLMGSGYRMNQVVTEIANRYNAAVAAQHPQQQEYATVPQEGEAAAVA